MDGSYADQQVNFTRSSDNDTILCTRIKTRRDLSAMRIVMITIKAMSMSVWMVRKTVNLWMGWHCTGEHMSCRLEQPSDE